MIELVLILSVLLFMGLCAYLYLAQRKKQALSSVDQQEVDPEEEKRYFEEAYGNLSQSDFEEARAEVVGIVNKALNKKLSVIEETLDIPKGEMSEVFKELDGVTLVKAIMHGSDELTRHWLDGVEPARAREMIESELAGARHHLNLLIDAPKANND